MPPWYSKQVSGKKLHALVVGVGSYPHANRAPWRLNQLPAAASSALAVAELIRDELQPDDAEVATIELLARKLGLIPPTFDEVKAAIQRWVERLIDKDDVAVLFFAGHGMERGGQPSSSSIVTPSALSDHTVASIAPLYSIGLGLSR